MVWIKRNLGFVISAVVGLLLTGYCSYLLYGAVAANKTANEDYMSTKGNLDELNNSSPFPSTENIQAVKDDQEHVRQFLSEFRTKFAPFPPPPVKDEKGFGKYLDDSLVQFRSEATNAGVEFPPGYAFGFSGLVGKLLYPAANIQPWMQQLQETASILNILYEAKINFLSSIKRVPVSMDDATMSDCLQAASVTNQWGIVTPYQIVFRGFSADLAAVLEGFARSSNCFIVKTVTVATDISALPQPTPAASQPPPSVYRPAPQYQMQQGRPRGANGFPMPGASFRPAPTAAPVTMAANEPPVTIFSESSLLVTLTVDVVKLKATEP